jgi:hypothetical protein
LGPKQGEKKVIAKFTNCFGETNYGVVIDRHPEGMICVFWVEFTALLMRLEQHGRVGDFVRKGLSKRVSWVRVETPRLNGATMELLPIDTPVQWNDNELVALQMKMTPATVEQEQHENHTVIH